MYFGGRIYVLDKHKAALNFGVERNEKKKYFLSVTCVCIQSHLPQLEVN